MGEITGENLTQSTRSVPRRARQGHTGARSPKMAFHTDGDRTSGVVVASAASGAKGLVHSGRGKSGLV
ncbi:hypothetical protein EVAR_44308_1 [Eumeta japonica]|uniref:Uncharacterized protein n=1 Tax=Eumeta variegata TaxID=151549 RepID=A0A4C1WT55_EUMVA|nr:hypothetical protein EVAR_44308_1 [Eumeta japonica]